MLIFNRPRDLSPDELQTSLLSPQTLFELVDVHLTFVHNAVHKQIEDYVKRLNILHGTTLTVFRRIWNIHIEIITSKSAHMDIFSDE